MPESRAETAERDDVTPGLGMDHTVMSESEVSPPRPTPDESAVPEGELRSLLSWWASAAEADDAAVRRVVLEQLAGVQAQLEARACWLYHWDESAERRVAMGTTLEEALPPSALRLFDELVAEAWDGPSELWVERSEVLEHGPHSAWGLPLRPGGSSRGLLLVLGTPEPPARAVVDRLSLTLGGLVMTLTQRRRIRHLEQTEQELAAAKQRLERGLALFERRREEVEAINIELRQSNQSLHDMMAQTADAIITCDPRGRITGWNSGARQLFGYTEREALGAHMSRLNSPSETQGAVLFNQALRGHAIADFETERRTKDGRTLIVSLTLLPIRKAAHEVGGVVAICRDVSDQRQRQRSVEEENARLQDQLMHAEKLALAGQLAASVAHDINNPLMYIMSNLSFLAGMLPDLRADAETLADVEDALSEAQQGAKRVLAISRDLKTFARDDQEPATAVEVTRAIDGILNMARAETRHRARLVCDYQPVPLVMANESRLGQVFLNLLVNASHAIAPGDTEANEIGVRVRPHGDRVHVEVRDTGEGIPPERLPRIFDPFFTTKSADSGSGLGLSICRRIVQGFGGDIEVESTVGKGSVFRVILPVAAGED